MTEQHTQTAGTWLDDFMGYVKQAIDIIQLKEDAIDRARDDEDAFTMGLAIIVLGGIGAAIGSSLMPFGFVMFPVFYLVGAFVSAAIVHLLATMVFKGEGEFIDFFRPYSLAYVLTWVTVIPILNMVLGLIAGLWMLAVAVICVERNYSLDRPQAIATVAIPMVTLLVLAMMMFAVLGIALFLGLR